MLHGKSRGTSRSGYLSPGTRPARYMAGTPGTYRLLLPTRQILLPADSSHVSKRYQVDGIYIYVSYTPATTKLATDQRSPRPAPRGRSTALDASLNTKRTGRICIVVVALRVTAAVQPVSLGLRKPGFSSPLPSPLKARLYSPLRSSSHLLLVFLLSMPPTYSGGC
jgi:hypothetical protein